MIIPNGKIIAIGGAEHKVSERTKSNMLPEEMEHLLRAGILSRIVKEAGGIRARIEIITTASSVPIQRGKEYIESFARLGCNNTGVMHIRSRQDIDEECLHRIDRCDAVLFTGGTQRRLSRVLSKTPLLDRIRSRFRQEQLLVAGTSAGAMALGRIMIYKGTAMFTHLKGHVKTMPGLDILPQVIFDSHFERSGRFARLVQIVALHPACLGIGLGEDTGVVISGANSMEVIGSGLVTIVNGRDILHNNMPDIPENTPPSIENIQVHFCSKGDNYLIRERIFKSSIINN